MSGMARGSERGAAAHACQARRFRLACVVVGAVAALLIACSVLEASAQCGAVGGAAAAVSAASFDAAMGGENDAFAAPASVPESFEEEFFPLSGLGGARWSSDECVVGWCEQGTADEALSKLADQLAAKGWVTVASSNAACRSFSKSGGVYRWAFASAAQVGGESSVVLQWSSAEEGTGDGA